ncbi:MAG: hypothetical protein ACKOOA_10095, partial [Sediminibacterium sp.]
MRYSVAGALLVIGFLLSCRQEEAFSPRFELKSAPRVTFNSFVDCNMAEAWIGDTFRIFPGKYGEDPLWG